jgi:hypothetical protein
MIRTDAQTAEAGSRLDQPNGGARPKIDRQGKEKKGKAADVQTNTCWKDRKRSGRQPASI